MAARIDPFVDVLLREQGDQLYLLPDEPVTMVKDGKPRKVSRQPLTDQHIYALLVEVAPSESADHIDQMTETEFEYIADRGMVRVRIVPDMGRLTAMVARVENSAATQSPAAGPAPAAQRAPAGAGATAPATPPPRPPKPSAIAAAPMVEAHAPGAAGTVDFAAAQYKGAERALGELLKALGQWASPLPGERGARPQRPDRRIPRDPGQGRERGAARHFEGSAAALLLDEGSGARHRADRLGQVHHAVRVGRSDQPHAHGPHHHDRGPDRVRAREQEVRHHAATGGGAHRHLQAGAAIGPAGGPGHRAGG